MKWINIESFNFCIFNLYIGQSEHRDENHEAKFQHFPKCCWNGLGLWFRSND